MKKKYLLISITLLSFVVFFGVTFAACTDSPEFCKIVGLFEKAATWMYRIFFIVAVMYILLAAFTYLQAGGDATKVQKATGMIKYAVIAIVVALLSTGAAAIINSFVNE